MSSFILHSMNTKQVITWKSNLLAFSVNFCSWIATICVQSSLSLCRTQPSPLVATHTHTHTHTHTNTLVITAHCGLTPPPFASHSSSWLELSGVRGSQWRMSIGLIHRHGVAHTYTHMRAHSHTHTHTHSKAIKERSRQNDRQPVMPSYLKCV